MNKNGNRHPELEDFSETKSEEYWVSGNKFNIDTSTPLAIENRILRQEGTVSLSIQLEIYTFFYIFLWFYIVQYVVIK